MPPISISGFITKKETSEQFQRSHRQLTRDLADAMKLQNPKVLDNCRLHTEDGETREGIGVTPELLDELRIKGKNPVWYLRVTWLEKTYGRRGHPQRREQTPAGAFGAGADEGSDVLSSRPDLVHVLRERIRGLEQDKQDLRDEMKIKNQQMTGEGGATGRGIPEDARYKPGSGGQLIAFVPSLDLVITRQTGSSGGWEYDEYLRRACAAVQQR